MVFQRMSKTLDIGVLGADGRMGGAIIRALASSDNIDKDASEVAGLKASGVSLGSDVKSALNLCDVLIDFSHPQAAIDTVLAMHDTRSLSGASGQSLANGLGY